MNDRDLLDRIDGASGTALLEELYGQAGVGSARERLARLVGGAAELSGADGDFRVFSTPGRTELGGNHTDHNRGKVVAASIQLDALAVVAPRSDGVVLFRSTGYDDVTVNLSSLAKREDETGTTAALIRGIAAELAARGARLGGFTAVANNTVLSGSGLSSSAAVEVLMGTIFDGLYGDGKREPLELARIGQIAENDYFGKPCGLMDQVACAYGGAVAIDFADSAAPEVVAVPLDLEASGWTLCVVDTGGSHEDLTADYAAVPQEMRAVAKELGVSVLRETGRDELMADLSRIRRLLGDRAILRAFHFFDENDRAAAMLEALRRGAAADADGDDAGRDRAVGAFLELAAASGDSSWRLLQNVSTPSRPREQGVALALALSAEFSRIACEGRGVFRVHGGGFAGTIQAYVPRSRAGDYAAWMEKTFGRGSVTQLRIRSRGTGELKF